MEVLVLSYALMMSACSTLEVLQDCSAAPGRPDLAEREATKQLIKTQEAKRGTWICNVRAEEWADEGRYLVREAIAISTATRKFPPNCCTDPHPRRPRYGTAAVLLVRASRIVGS